MRGQNNCRKIEQDFIQGPEPGPAEEKAMRKILSVLLAVMMMTAAVPACFGEEETPDVSWIPGMTAPSVSEEMKARGQVVTTILTEPFYEGVTDEDTAGEALTSVMEQLGADESTQVMLDSVYETEGLTYYIYRQIVGDVVVEGAAAKLIVDEDGTAICAIGSLVAGLDIQIPEEKELTEEQAESIVKSSCEMEDARIQKGMTHQAVVEIDSDRRLVWVVYTDNPVAGLDVGYMAHYVSDQGEYLGLNPMAVPYSTNEETNSISELVFQGMEPDVWSGDVTLFDGTTRPLTVPVMKDAEGNRYLGDVQRKIVCADYAQWENESNLEMRVEKDGRFDDGELLIYESIIRVWDFYNMIGWEGADGKGTPILLEMDLVDENGDPIHNAYYSGQTGGFQTFAFNRDERDGETLDIIGHEFTHCVTTTISVEAPYLNDCGAINEALSDIMGNLMEEMLDASDDPEWLIGEAAKNPAQILRCMSDPHLYHQPEYVWDNYYVPAVSVGTQENDQGGVHMNSSLLNLIAWRLHEAGMAPEDEFDYFMNVILTMTGTVAYPDLAVLLPWCLKQVKMDEFMESLTAAIEETGIGEILPTRIPEGYALTGLMVPEELEDEAGELQLVFIGGDGIEETQQYFFSADDRLGAFVGLLPAGLYCAQLVLEKQDRVWMLQDAGWTEAEGGLSGEDFPEPVFHEYGADEFYELPDVLE